MWIIAKHSISCVNTGRLSKCLEFHCKYVGIRLTNKMSSFMFSWGLHIKSSKNNIHMQGTCSDLGWKTTVGFHSSKYTSCKFGEKIYLINLNCRAHFGNRVTQKGSKNILPKYHFEKWLMITKILCGKQNHAVQNKIWPELSDGVH